MTRKYDRNKIKFIAKICHTVHKSYCASLGDDSQPDWVEAPEWQKKSAIAGVEYHLNNNVTPEQSHEFWMAEKERDGWTYSEIKDPILKTHPSMVPYDQLSEQDRAKDYIFHGVVNSFK